MTEDHKRNEESERSEDRKAGATADRERSDASQPGQPAAPVDGQTPSDEARHGSVLPTEVKEAAQKVDSSSQPGQPAVPVDQNRPNVDNEKSA